MADCAKTIKKRIWITLALKLSVSAVVALVLYCAAQLLLALPQSTPVVFRWGAALFFFASLLAVVVWVFFLCSVWFRNAIISVICFSLLFVWGSAGYFMWHVDRNSESARTGEEARAEIVERQLEAPNRAIAAFFPSRGGFEDVDNRYRRQYFFFHLLVIAFVAAVMFSHFGRGLVNRIRKRYMSPVNSLNVFWDTTDVSLMLACDAVRTSEWAKVAFMLPRDLLVKQEDFKLVTRKLDAFDAIWVPADIGDLRKSDLRGHRHFFLDESGHVNVGRAQKFVEAMRRYGLKKPDDVFLYVRIEAEEEERIFFEWAKSVKDYVTPIIFRESDMIARNFIREHPMLDAPDISTCPEKAEVHGSFRILLLGLGSTGQSMLREMVCNGQFVGLSGFSVDVIESDEAVVEAYKSQHAEAIEKYNIRFIEKLQAEGVGFEGFLSENLMSYNRIVVCLAGDVMNIRVATRLAHYVTKDGMGLKAGVLFVRVSDSIRSSYFKPSKKKMVTFGNLSDVYSLNAMDMDPIDQMAKILNGEWEKDKSDKGLTKAWLGASFGNRRSSRASALGQRNMARVLGFEVVPQDDPRAAIPETEFKSALGNGRERILAIDEHLRWNAYHRMLGYSCWDMKNPPIEQFEDKKANQLDLLGKHACLVDFDELPTVDHKIACAIRPENAHALSPKSFEGDVEVDIYGDGKRKGSLQSYDYKFVRKVWENATAAGMKLVRSADSIQSRPSDGSSVRPEQ